MWFVKCFFALFSLFCIYVKNSLEKYVAFCYNAV